MLQDTCFYFFPWTLLRWCMYLSPTKPTEIAICGRFCDGNKQYKQRIRSRLWQCFLVPTLLREGSSLPLFLTAITWALAPSVRLRDARDVCGNQSTAGPPAWHNQGGTRQSAWWIRIWLEGNKQYEIFYLYQNDRRKLETEDVLNKFVASLWNLEMMGQRRYRFDYPDDSITPK